MTLLHPDRISGITDADGARQWSLVIPVKQAALAKSRLRVAGIHHETLSRAIAIDTIMAAAACTSVARVHVVTADAVTAAGLRWIERIEVVPDPGGGLERAIETGLAIAGAGTDRAVLLGDLPALRCTELAAALASASEVERGFVADADGTGTSLATARAGVPFPVLFGRDSARAHRDVGFRGLLAPDDSGLRRDVDIAAHLLTVEAIGTGPRTSAMLRHVLA